MPLTLAPPSARTLTLAPPSARTLTTLTRRFGAGEPLACEPLDRGLLNRGYRLSTTRGSFFLKHHLGGDPHTVLPLAARHRATVALAARGLPVVPPLADSDGNTVARLRGRNYALHPWVDGRHRDGGELSIAHCRRLGALLGRVHRLLAHVMAGGGPGAGPCGAPAAVAENAEPDDTLALIDRLIGRITRQSRRTGFDELAEHRLRERRGLLDRYACRRPGQSATPAAGWVHGDFHPFNLLYRSAGPVEPVAIIDWDRLGVRPRAEEAVRAAAIFFVRQDGRLDLEKVRAYSRAYRASARITPGELAAAVRRVWWERLNDFWMLRWHYELRDPRADWQFAASSALIVWWTRNAAAVCDAFSD